MPKEDGSLSELARSLLAAERSSVEPAPLKERALARARRAMAAERLSGTELSQRVSRHARAFGGRKLRVGLLAAAALAMAGLAMAGAGLLQRSDQVQAVRVNAPAPAPSATPPRSVPDVEPVAREAAPLPPPIAPSALGPVVTTPSLRVRPAAGVTSSGSDSTRALSAQTYAIELSVLEPARSAIARGSYAEALGAVARHQREFPSGQLAEERSALRVRALWGLGRIAEAEAAAAAFRQRYPRSALLAWMRPRSAPSP